MYAVLAAMTLWRACINVGRDDRRLFRFRCFACTVIVRVASCIIYAMLMLMFFRRRNSVVVQSVIVLAVWTYVFIAGCRVSAVRSAVMLTVIFVCQFA